jgi:hypothetical protein
LPHLSKLAVALFELLLILLMGFEILEGTGWFHEPLPVLSLFYTLVIKEKREVHVISCQVKKNPSILRIAERRAYSQQLTISSP